MKSWLHGNGIEMYSTYNKRKSVVAERFIRTSKSKIYKLMTAVSKNVYIDKLDEIVNKHNKTYKTMVNNIVRSKYIFVEYIYKKYIQVENWALHLT